MSDSTHHPPPIALTVVVAALDSAPDVGRCLRAIASQVAGRPIEILLVANPAHARAADAARAIPEVTLVVAPIAGLVPDLWALGIQHARGVIIAVTISGCVPAPGWIDAMLDAHRGSDAAVGGPIVQDARAGFADWAVCFTRYGAYFPPLPATAVPEVPGDNGSYKHDALAPDLDAIARMGFWEVEVNAALRSRGASLRMDPRMTVTHTHSYGVAAFCRQRWIHGRRFGAERAARLGLGARLARVAAAPVTLAVMLARAGGHARRAGSTGRFVMAAPIVTLFYAAWLAGESAGLLARAR